MNFRYRNRSLFYPRPAQAALGWVGAVLAGGGGGAGRAAVVGRGPQKTEPPPAPCPIWPYKRLVSPPNSLSGAWCIFKGNAGFPSLAPSPPAAKLTLESISYVFFSFNFWLKTNLLPSSAWFHVFLCGLLPERKGPSSITCRSELQTPSQEPCRAFRTRLKSERSKHDN